MCHVVTLGRGKDEPHIKDELHEPQKNLKWNLLLTNLNHVVDVGTNFNNEGLLLLVRTLVTKDYYCGDVSVPRQAKQRTSNTQW